MTERFAYIAETIALIIGETLSVPEQAGIATPADLTGLMPFTRVNRTGGPRDLLSDYARITVEVIDDDYARGLDLAEDISELLQPGWLRRGTVLIDRVTVDNAPQETAPWAPGVYRFEASYTVISRRHSVA